MGVCCCGSKKAKNVPLVIKPEVRPSPKPVNPNSDSNNLLIQTHKLKIEKEARLTLLVRKRDSLFEVSI